MDHSVVVRDQRGTFIRLYGQTQAVFFRGCIFCGLFSWHVTSVTAKYVARYAVRHWVQGHDKALSEEGTGGYLTTIGQQSHHANVRLRVYPANVLTACQPSLTPAVPSGR